MARLLCLLFVLLSTTPSAGEVLDTAPDLYAPRGVSGRDVDAAAGFLAEAKQAAEAGEISAALQLATRALRFDPDEPTCRNVLGYELHQSETQDNRWLTAFQRKQIDRGFAWDARFGWVKAEELPRYERGERPPSRKTRGRRWVSVEEDAKQHALIEEGWRVHTDHFQVTSNHSLGAAVRLATELEQLFQVWRQLFAGYYLGEAEVRARFAGTRTARSRAKPFNVFYHRDRSGYVAHLRHKNPRVAGSLGVYFDDLKEAHFFAPDPNGAGEADANANELRATLYHEAVHQLFQESKRTRRGVGDRHSFWAVEGVACYFESLTPTGGGRYKIGQPTAGRLPTARVRLLHPDPSERYSLPLAEMTSLGRNDLQRRSDLPRLYGQTAAVATFLMHADGGRRREPFVRFLVDLYSGKAREGALAGRLGEPLSDLEVSYQRWLTEP